MPHTFDFGTGMNNADNGAPEQVQDLDNGTVGTPGTDGTIIPPIDKEPTIPEPGDGNKNNNNNNNNSNNNNLNNNNTNDNNNNDNNFDLTPGTSVTIDDNVYTVDDKGNLIDKDNNIFKEAKDVQEYLKQFNVEANDATEGFDIQSIIDKVGIDIVDENDKPVEFENTAEGIASYINNVVELRQEELVKSGIEKVFTEYPILSDFLNYYIANGNSYEGFGQVKDRSNITIDENNITQQEAIVRESLRESNFRGDIENYIKYLKDSNLLLNTAKTELQAMQERDKQYRINQEETAKENLRQQQEANIAKWNTVKSIIDKREIAGYKIPETIIAIRDGKKVAYTPNDFFNYLYQVDNDGNSQYDRDLANMDSNKQIENNILQALLYFTGGSFSNLIDMAVASKTAANLKLSSKTSHRKSTIQISKPKPNKTTADDIMANAGIN